MGNPIGWIIVLVIAILVLFYGLLYHLMGKSYLNKRGVEKVFFFFFCTFQCVLNTFDE